MAAEHKAEMLRLKQGRDRTHHRRSENSRSPFRTDIPSPINAVFLQDDSEHFGLKAVREDQHSVKK